MQREGTHYNEPASLNRIYAKKMRTLQMVKFSITKKVCPSDLSRQFRHNWVTEIISIIKKTLPGNKARCALPSKLVCPFLHKPRILCQKLKCTENVNLETHSLTYRVDWNHLYYKQWPRLEVMSKPAIPPKIGCWPSWGGDNPSQAEMHRKS